MPYRQLIRHGGRGLCWGAARRGIAAPHRFASPVLAKALHPPDRGTDAGVELFSRFTAGTPCFNKTDDPPSQFTRIRSTDRLTLPIMSLTKMGTYCSRTPSEIHNIGALSDGYSHVADVCFWPSTSVRCDAAILSESEVDRTRRGHRENGAHDPNRP